MLLTAGPIGPTAWKWMKRLYCTYMYVPIKKCWYNNYMMIQTDGCCSRQCNIKCITFLCQRQYTYICMYIVEFCGYRTAYWSEQALRISICVTEGQNLNKQVCSYSTENFWLIIIIIINFPWRKFQLSWCKLGQEIFQLTHSTMNCFGLPTHRHGNKY